MLIYRDFLRPYKLWKCILYPYEKYGAPRPPIYTEKCHTNYMGRGHVTLAHKRSEILFLVLELIPNLPFFSKDSQNIHADSSLYLYCVE